MSICFYHGLSPFQIFSMEYGRLPWALSFSFPLLSRALKKTYGTFEVSQKAFVLSPFSFCHQCFASSTTATTTSQASSTFDTAKHLRILSLPISKERSYQLLRLMKMHKTKRKEAIPHLAYHHEEANNFRAHIYFKDNFNSGMVGTEKVNGGKKKLLNKTQAKLSSFFHINNFTFPCNSWPCHYSFPIQNAKDIVGKSSFAITIYQHRSSLRK